MKQKASLFFQCQKEIPFLVKLFIWSLLLEPLLFFVLFDRSISGVTGNLSRLIQMVVVIGLSVKGIGYVLSSSKKSLNFLTIGLSNPLYLNYRIYFLITLLAGVLGFLLGAYTLPVAYDVKESTSAFSQLLNSAVFRPIVEYFITIYYFVYFVVLPSFMINSYEKLSYFFKMFKRIFIISLVLGLIDFVLSIFGHGFIPRHLADGVLVGPRFHGLAGEPRDGFVYLFFGLAIFYLYAHFQGVVFNRWWIPIIILTALLTQSASGLIGIAFFLILYLFYNIPRLSIQRFMQLAVVIALGSGLIYLAATKSERIVLYLESASDLWQILETRGHIPYLMSVQIANIYPLYDLTVKFRHLEFLPILIGSGLGSASVVNNLYNYIYTGISAEMNNPYSQFPRIIFESGMIGLYFFVRSFYYPVKLLIKSLPKKKQHAFVLFTFLLLGCFLGHRSLAAFIYLGIFITTFRVLGQNSFAYVYR